MNNPLIVLEGEAVAESSGTFPGPLLTASELSSDQLWVLTRPVSHS